MDFVINAAKPVSFNEKAIAKRLEQTGSLIADLKLDGVRCHLVIKPTADIGGRPAARLYAISRTNKSLPSLVSLYSSPEEQLRLARFLAESRYPEGIVIDGEATVRGMTFQQGCGRLRKKAALPKEDLVFYVYGVLPLTDLVADSKADIETSNCVMQMHCDVALYQLRKEFPEVSWTKPTSYEVYNMEGLMEIYEQVREAGHEGLVIKDPLDVWHRGKKAGWWKMKNSDTIDGNVIEPVWGTEGKANEGLVIGFDVLLENGRVVTVTGITQAQMQEFTANVTNNPDYYKDWSLEISYMEETDEGSLRHPSFDCWRGTETDPTLKA